MPNNNHDTRPCNQTGVSQLAAGNPTPLALARLMDAFCDPAGANLNETQMALYFHFQDRPKLCRVLHVQLLRQAADAGMACHAWDYLVDAAESAQGFQWLLIARAWKHPAEVLDPLAERWVDYGQILNILDARLRRGEGNAEHLGQVRRRLLVAVQEQTVAQQEDQARDKARARAKSETKTISSNAPKGAASRKPGLGSREAPAPSDTPAANKKKRKK